MLGRVKAYEAIVKGENIPEPGIPESFKVLVKEMQSLCLDVEIMSEEGEQIELKEDEDDVFRTAEELGLDLTGMDEAPRSGGRGGLGEAEGLDDLDTSEIDLSLEFSADDDAALGGDE